MLRLNANAISYDRNFLSRKLLILTKNTKISPLERHRYALLIDGLSSYDEGFGAYLTFDSAAYIEKSMHFTLGQDLDYLTEDDVIRVGGDGRINSLYRRNSTHNTVLLTEQCNHYCLMCSQPPKNVDDSWLLEDAMELIDLIPNDTKNIGFTGGEPTLYGDSFIQLIAKMKTSLPNTAIDVLSNGRSFADQIFSKKFAEIDHPDCVIGIPIYSDDPVRHDYVVQSEGAFDETIKGILNLKKMQQKVEIRIVIHRETIDRLPQTCEYIARNLLFVDHVALMGLEITGFTRANLDKLWIDPIEYKDTLSEAIQILNAYGINSSVYNHQLCLVNNDILSNYKKSISDWKNEYVKECESCTKIDQCGGFFSSSKQFKYSDHIKPFN